mgnify:CR=1 FL=1
MTALYVRKSQAEEARKCVACNIICNQLERGYGNKRLTRGKREALCGGYSYAYAGKRTGARDRREKVALRR